MTNGEKIMQAFPDLQIDMGELEVYMWTTIHDAIDIPLDWWNAEYKEPSNSENSNKSEIPTGSTTKTCRSCKNYGTHHGICEICKDNKCWTGKEPTIKNDLGVDCISREQAIKQCGFGMTSLLIADNLRKLPPVAPQSRKGHWEHGRELSRVFIGDALKGINYEDWHCSNCHCVIEQSIKPKWNYCPNCGSDNREVEE